jgi:hypothetical protein
VVIFFARTTPRGEPRRPPLAEPDPRHAAASLSSNPSLKP